jgi:hypothetical protein
METLLFVAFVAVFGLIIFLPAHKSRKQTDLRRRQRAQKASAQSNRLSTPADHLMAHKREVWQKRQQKVSREGTERPDFIPRFEKAGDGEYDGYSRRDRHHLTPTGSAKKQQPKEEEFTMTAVKFEPDMDLKPAASGKG